MTPIQLVIFDLAGTTLQENGIVPAVFTETLQSYGITVPSHGLNQFRGASKREVIGNFVPSTVKSEEVYRRFCANLAGRFLTNGMHEIEGASDTFHRCKEKDIFIALNTGFERQITELLINEVGWDRTLFRAVVCADDVPHGRPAPDLIRRAMEISGIKDPQSVANIGDTVLDLQAGWNAGVQWNIGVLSGAHSREQLQLEPHTHLIPSVRYVPEILC